MIYSLGLKNKLVLISRWSLCTGSPQSRFCCTYSVILWYIHSQWGGGQWGWPVPGGRYLWRLRSCEPSLLLWSGVPARWHHRYFCKSITVAQFLGRLDCCCNNKQLVRGCFILTGIKLKLALQAAVDAFPCFSRKYYDRSHGKGYGQRFLYSIHMSASGILSFLFSFYNVLTHPKSFQLFLL